MEDISMDTMFNFNRSFFFLYFFISRKKGKVFLISRASHESAVNLIILTQNPLPVQIYADFKGYIWTINITITNTKLLIQNVISEA